MPKIYLPEEINNEEAETERKEGSLVFHPNMADVTKEPLPRPDPDVSAFELEPTGRLKVWSYSSNEGQELGRKESLETIGKLIMLLNARRNNLDEQLAMLYAMQEKIQKAEE